MITIGYFLRDEGGCGYYRQELPFKMLAHHSNGKYRTGMFKQGDAFSRLEEIVEKSDIFVIPRLCEPEFLTMLGELRKKGKKFIVDADDNMFKVSPLSPHYKDMGTENIEVHMENGAVKMKLWEDGKEGFSVKKNAEMLANLKKGLEQADLVTCTTPILADVFRQYNLNVRDVRNLIDAELWRRPNFRPREDIRMGWFGGFSHYEDWLVLANILPKIMKKYSNLKLVLMGSRFDGVLRHIEDQSRIEYHDWVHTKAYPYKAALLDLDFALIPLKDTEFNRCKSNIKWVEMGALEVPSVTSAVSPYKEWGTEKNGIFIEDNDEAAWEEGISLMVENKDLRVEMGKEARKTVEEHFDANKMWTLWDDVITELMAPKTPVVLQVQNGFIDKRDILGRVELAIPQVEASIKGGK